jgi:hypothetical protein
MLQLEDYVKDRWHVYKRTIIERMCIYIKKEQGATKPWTQNPTLRDYRFCNVFRDLDKTYKLLEQLIKEDTPGYWGARLMLRWSSSTPLIEAVRREDYKWRECLAGDVEPLIDLIIEDYEGPLVTGSFIVKRPGGKQGDRYMFRQYFYVLRELANQWLQFDKGALTIKEFCATLQDRLPWCGSFTSYCIASDLMYDNRVLAYAPDLYTWAAQGPGAIRGLAYLYNTTEAEIKRNWNQLIPFIVNLWTKEGEEIRSVIWQKVGQVPVADRVLKPMALDVEHWFCEYFKYVRGNAKRRYNG